MIDIYYGKQDSSPIERLKYLNECLEKMDIDDVRQSIEYLVIQAGKNNMQAQTRLSELAEGFSNLNISFDNLVHYIEKKFIPE